MNSQVRKTLTVLMIGSALALGLVVISPDTLPVANTASVQLITADGMSAEAPAVSTLADTFQATATPPATAEHVRRKSGKPSRIRHSVAMPFFSFAPRG